MCSAQVLNAVEKDLFSELSRFAVIGENLDCRSQTEIFIHLALQRSPEDVALDVLKAHSSFSPSLFAQDENGMTPLLLAASNGLTSVASDLVAYGANQTTIDESRRSVLHYAAPFPSTTLKLIMQLNPDVVVELLAIQDVEGNTPLHLALLAGQTQSARRILDRIATVDYNLGFVVAQAANDKGETALHLNSDVIIFRRLRDFRTSYTRRTVAGALPVHTVAGLTGSVTSGTLQLIFKRSKSTVQEVDNSGRIALHYAAECGDADTVSWLIAAGSEVRARDNSGIVPLKLGLAKKHYQLVPIFDAAGGFPLQAAVQEGDVEAVKHLVLNMSIATDAVDNVGRSAFFEAAELGFLAVAEFLLSRNASIIRTDHTGVSVLGAAVLARQVEMVSFLLSQGAPVMQRLANYSAALHLAAREGSNETINVLLAAGADIQALDYKNRSALHFASTREAVDALLRAGATSTRSADSGLLPLHYAALEGRAKALEVLLASRSSQVEEKDWKNNTALHYACNAGKIEAVKILLQWCAETLVVNSDGLFPSQLATDATVRSMANGDIVAPHRCECDCGAYVPGVEYIALDWKTNCAASVRCRFDQQSEAEAVSCTRDESVELELVGSKFTGQWSPAMPVMQCQSIAANTAVRSFQGVVGVQVILAVVFASYF